MNITTKLEKSSLKKQLYLRDLFVILTLNQAFYSGIWDSCYRWFCWPTYYSDIELLVFWFFSIYFHKKLYPLSIKDNIPLMNLYHFIFVMIATSTVLYAVFWWVGPPFVYLLFHDFTLNLSILGFYLIFTQIWIVIYPLRIIYIKKHLKM